MNTFKTMIKFLPAILLAVSLFWGNSAQAQVYGSPIPELGQGKMAVGVAIADYSRRYRNDAGSFAAVVGRQTFFFDYGIDGAMIRGEVGTVDHIGGDQGTELAGSYRQAFGKKRKAGKKEMVTGFMAGGRYYTMETLGFTVDVLQIDVAGGAEIGITKEFAVYAAGVLTYISGESTSGTVTSEFSGDSLLGIYGGAHYTLDDAFMLGAELHMMSDSGLGIYGKFYF